MPKHVTEEQFETDIVESLVDHGGYTQGDKTHFDTTIGLDTTELFAFIEATQPKGLGDAGETPWRRPGGGSHEVPVSPGVGA